VYQAPPLSKTTEEVRRPNPDEAFSEKFDFAFSESGWESLPVFSSWEESFLEVKKLEEEHKKNPPLFIQLK